MSLIFTHLILRAVLDASITPTTISPTPSLLIISPECHDLAKIAKVVIYFSLDLLHKESIGKYHVATAAAHIWTHHSIIKQLQVHSLNVTPIEAELMAIHTGLIPAMEIDGVHEIMVITDSIAVAKKILESKVNPLQNMFIPLASAIKTFFSKDGRNNIRFWYCPSKAEWPRHKLVDDQVKASACTPTFPSKESHLFSRKKECDNILCEW